MTIGWLDDPKTIECILIILLNLNKILGTVLYKSLYFAFVPIQDTYGNFAELRHVTDSMIKQGHPRADDISAQKEYMDTVCRSFASRLERRRNLLICSVRFHRLAEQVALSTLLFRVQNFTYLLLYNWHTDPCHLIGGTYITWHSLLLPSASAIKKSYSPMGNSISHSTVRIILVPNVFEQ